MVGTVHRMLTPTEWHLVTAESQSLYISVTTEEWKLLMREPGLRARIEAMLVHLRGSIDVRSLLFVHVEKNHRRTVAELVREPDGAVRWEWDRAGGQASPGPVATGSGPVRSRTR